MALGLKARKRRQIGYESYEIQEVYICLNAEAESNARFLWSSMEGTGRSATLVKDVQWQKDGYGKGKAKIELLRRTPTTMEYLRANTNKGVLFTNSTSTLRRANANSQGEIIQGLDPADPTGRTKWQLVKGEGVIPEVDAVFIIRTFTTRPSVYVTQMQELENAVNTNRMSSRFGKYAAPRKLRLAKVKSWPDTYTAGAEWVDYYLQGKAVGWCKETSARSKFQLLPWLLGTPWKGPNVPTPDDWMYYSLKMKKVSQKVFVYDEDGNVSDETKGTVIWIPYKETSTSPYQWRFGPKFVGASFSLIDNLIRWL